MPHITGQQRNQMMMFSLESSVASGSFKIGATILGLAELCKTLKKCCFNLFYFLFRPFLSFLQLVFFLPV